MSPGVTIDLTANLWFSIASVLLLTVLVSIVTEKIVEPRLGAYTGEAKVETKKAMSPEESRGLRFAFWGLVGTLVFIALLALPPGAPLRNPETGALRAHVAAEPISRRCTDARCSWGS